MLQQRNALMPDHRRNSTAPGLADLTPSAPSRLQDRRAQADFSSRHIRSLRWLAERLPEAGLAAEIDGIGNVLGRTTQTRSEIAGRSHLASQNLPAARWALGVVYALEAARVINGDPNAKGRSKSPLVR